MPQFRNIIVEVIDHDGKPLREWGKTTTSKGRVSSCYVQAESNRSFGISMRPVFFPATNNYFMPLGKFQWHILATLRLNGCEEPEKRSIIFLDPEHRYFKPEGRVVMNSRTKRDADGKVRTRKWFFCEHGIHTLLEDLQLDHVDAQDVMPINQDMLAESMKQLGANDFKDQEERAKTGLIEITFEQVKLKEDSTDVREAEDASTYRHRAEKHTSHSIAQDAGVLAPETITCIDYEPLVADQAPYATVKFFCRSEEILRKYDFPGFPKKTTDSELAKATAFLTVRGKRPVNDDSDDDIPASKKQLHEKRLPSNDSDNDDSAGEDEAPAKRLEADAVFHDYTQSDQQ